MRHPKAPTRLTTSRTPSDIKGLYGLRGEKHRCSYVVGRLLTNKPEVSVCALSSMTEETGMPKVIGLHPLQVLSALITERGMMYTSA